MIKCPICKRRISVKYKVDNAGEIVEWYHCFCGTIFHNKGINKNYFDKAYQEKWMQMKEVEKRFDYLMRTYLPFIEDLTYGRKFLDVGFTLPYHIKLLARRGWITTGIDLIENEYIKGDFEKFDFKANKFDFILFGHCLESFIKPVEAIEKAYNLLNPQGILMITTPNPELIFLDGLKEFGHWMHKEKWIFISKEQLKKMICKIGFKWVLGRRNISQRYIVWNDIHVILQKVEYGY